MAAEFPDAELSEFPYDQRAKILKGDDRAAPATAVTRWCPSRRSPWSGSDPAACVLAGEVARAPIWGRLQASKSATLRLRSYLKSSLELFFPGAKSTFHIGVRYNPNSI